jgi:hypothetical protein
MKKYCLFLSLVMCFNCAYSITWTTTASGYWNNGLIWKGNSSPSFHTSDTLIIKHPIVLTEDLILKSKAYLLIEGGGGICGHKNITVNSGAHILKYGILELDTLYIPGGKVNCLGPGQVTLYKYAVITNGGFLSVSGCQFSVGPWFDCVLPEYNFVLTNISEIKALDFKIFPNPNSGNFILQLPRAEETTFIEVIDLSGRIIYRTLEPANGSEEIKINGLAKGIYICKISRNNQFDFKKILVQ